MAFFIRRTSVDDSIKQKSVLRNKHVYRTSQKPDPKRVTINMCQLSPEAQTVMNMTTQKDTQENMPSCKQTEKTDQMNVQDNNNILPSDTNIFNNVKDSKFDLTAASISSVNSRLRGTPTCRKTTSSVDASAQTGTSRSRSTLSLTDRNFSISDNTESCYNYNNKIKVINDAIPSFDIKDSSITSTVPTTTQKCQKQLQTFDDDYVIENSNKVNDDEEDQENEKDSQPQSFVLALERILEENCISRLKGDITNNTRVSEPGHVRALNGGRLTNAQEVVVNVCHDDDRELVFHDDDEESLSNAKVISDIRISLWMKYNEIFQPDDLTDDLYTGPTEDDEVKLSTTNETTVPNVNKIAAGKSHSVSRDINKTKSQTTKRDVNNNGASAKLNSAISNSLKDMKSTKTRSTYMQHAVKKSRVPSLTMEINKLKL